MFRSRVSAAAAVAVFAAGGLALVGCSSTPAPAPTVPSQSETAPPVGGDPATWAPIEINPLAEQSMPITMLPNQRAVFVGITDGKAYTVVSQDATIVEGVDGAAGQRPGLIAVKPGTSVVQLQLDGGMVYNPVTIEVVPTS